MSDRSNPILFGPEWLRNLPRERGLGNSGGQHGGNNMNNPNNQSTNPGASGAGASMAPPGIRRNGNSGEFSASSQSSNQNIQGSNGSSVGVRVQLANLRYGREEMLALYEAAAEPPQELKNYELLYQPRGKLPFALSTSFEEEMRENLRTSPHAGSVPSTERFSSGRGGVARAVPPSPDNVNRPRFRATVLNRSPIAVSGEVQGDPSTRPQLNARARYQPNEHKGFYLNYTGANVMFRNKRQNNTTNSNWRSPQTRESGEEWRTAEGTRSRSGQERDRERPGDRPQGGTRRSLSDHDETMPEWAFANAEPCAGTFDASGAFHGYSNDDSNLPKASEGGYSLARSRTHNTLSRSKTVEEGSEEWWASEKAKKLSPKRFDAGDIKFKQGIGVLEGANKGMSHNSKTGKEEYDGEQKESPSVSPEPEDKDKDYEIAAEHQSYKQQFSENKTYDSMMRQEMNMEEQQNDTGNFKSVMINKNNSLRQKHQNIVASSISDNQIPMNRSHPVMLKFQNQNQLLEAEHQKQHQILEGNIIDRFLDMTLESNDISNSGLMGPSTAGVTTAMSNAVNSLPQIPGQGIPLAMQGSNSGPGLSLMNAQGLSTLNLQPPTHNITQGLPSVGLNNHSMVLPPQLEFGPNSAMGIPMPVVPQGVIHNSGLSNHGLGGNTIQNAAANLPSFPSATGMPGMSNVNTSNTSLLFGKNLSNSSIPQTGDIPMPPNHNVQSGNIFPIHGLQHSGSPNTFGSSMFNNLLQSQPASNQTSSLTDQWYYEDPEKNTQGPFTSREMYRWYRAGFFTPSLMVRRACESQMRPLGSYGPLVPFAQLDVLPPFPMSGFDTRAPLNHSTLGPSVMNVPNNSEPTSHVKPLPSSLQNQMHISLQNPMHILMPNPMQRQLQSPMPIPGSNAMQHPIQNTLQFGNVRITRIPPLGQPQNMFDSLWGQPPQDVMWMQRNENRVNNLPMYFWDQQASNSILPENITKEMKTEDQILAQLRASQSIGSQPNTAVGTQSKTSLAAEPQSTTATTSRPREDAFASAISTPYFDELQKMIHKEILSTPSTEPSMEESQPILQEKTPVKNEQPVLEQNNGKSQLASAANQTKSEPKVAKQTKPDNEKAIKNKENTNTKNKNKKGKEEKKDDPEVKVKEENSIKAEQKISEESSPIKNKKEDKTNKKELEKEKKEWLKEGFTIVKGAEKPSKDSKKKAEEAKAAEEAEKKRKEEDRLAVEEDRKKKQSDIIKKQQEQQQLQQQRQLTESLIKKAPWSASTQTFMAPNKEGLTLMEIQRLEREKKLEQMKEQQQMMAILAQQQAAAMAREQEMQANLGWAKKKSAIPSVTSQSLAEIQAETRKQAMAASAATVLTQAVEEERPPPSALPWGQTHNGGGFWDSPAPVPVTRSEKSIPEVKVESQPRPKKKAATVIVATAAAAETTAGGTAAASNTGGGAAAATPPFKKEPSPAAEFDTWCTTTLKAWSSKIDVPTFIGFLKDIESPYEVKDYVKCYLGESKDTCDFSRQFLERRSKLLRVGMVTPSDDLCSPAMAINPRTNSGSDYQEVKGKGKKAKKNKMLKVDARILGFSVTAAEDRINVGDIDTA